MEEESNYSFTILLLQTYSSRRTGQQPFVRIISPLQTKLLLSRLSIVRFVQSTQLRSERDFQSSPFYDRSMRPYFTGIQLFSAFRML